LERAERRIKPGQSSEHVCVDVGRRKKRIKGALGRDEREGRGRGGNWIQRKKVCLFGEIGIREAPKKMISKGGGVGSLQGYIKRWREYKGGS